MSATTDSSPSAPSASRDDLDFAVDIAKRAGSLTLEYFNKRAFDVMRKADGSPVTNADKDAEAILREAIESYDPHATVVGEEMGDKPGDNERRWFLDPIDGTTGFTRGVPLWSNLVSLWDEHGPAVGVISLPAIGEVIAAGRGLGCTLNGEKCSVSRHDALAGALITTWGYEQWPLGVLSDLQGSDAVLRGWGDGYGYALLASGRVDAVVDYGCHIWDYAPMKVIVPEAGGICETRALDAAKEMVLATNGLIHAALAEHVFDD